MFKSLIQPFQLFLKGATGKDRHQKQQLSQQLVRLEMTYEALQESCNTLQHKHDTIERERNQLQQRYDRLKRDRELLQRDRNELNALFNCADQENQALEAKVRGMRSQIKRLRSDNAALDGKILYLEHKLGLQIYSDEEIAAAELRAAEGSILSEVEGRESLEDLTLIDLSNISLALVGGHETTHREVSEELKKYGLKRCIHVPPHSRESNSRHQIKEKIGNCDLVVTITSYIDHSVSNCVKQLKDNSMLTGEVIRIHCHGKSGVVREVLQYFMA